jgi:hypothetical protein
MHRHRLRNSDVSVPRTCFITGMGSVFNLLGSYYRRNVSKNDQVEDAKALRNDWYLIGPDINAVLKDVKTPSFQVNYWMLICRMVILPGKLKKL